MCCANPTDEVPRTAQDSNAIFIANWFFFYTGYNDTHPIDDLNHEQKQGLFNYQNWDTSCDHPLVE